MKCQINKDPLSVLINENSLSELAKANVVSKINNLLTFMNYLKTATYIDANFLQSTYSSLLTEQKSTLKTIVYRNNSLSKNLIKSMSTQKENLLQVIEVNQLHLEAELKKLNTQISYPTLKTETTIFNKIFNLFKLPFRNTSSSKDTASLPNIRKQINLTSNKLHDLEKQKEKLTKEVGTTGNESLKQLNNITYKLFLPASDISNIKLENLKNKMTILK